MPHEIENDHTSELPGDTFLIGEPFALLNSLQLATKCNHCYLMYLLEKLSSVAVIFCMLDFLLRKSSDWHEVLIDQYRPMSVLHSNWNSNEHGLTSSVSKHYSNF
jgi:hypothetical protein